MAPLSQVQWDNLWCPYEGDKKALYGHANKYSCVWALEAFEFDGQSFVLSASSDG